MNHVLVVLLDTFGRDLELVVPSEYVLAPAFGKWFRGPEESLELGGGYYPAKTSRRPLEVISGAFAQYEDLITYYCQVSHLQPT